MGTAQYLHARKQCRVPADNIVHHSAVSPTTQLNVHCGGICKSDE